MTDVAELEKRISAALERISVGLGEIGNRAREGAADDSELAVLRDTLETERTANAQLEQRVIAIKEKQEKLVRSLEAEVSRLREELAGREGDIRQVKQVNKRLRENNRALREANEQGVGKPELINAGMLAELDGLRASRESDRSELDAILHELKPLVEGAANA